jgi:DNA repair protein RecO (recombination protein O)
VERYADRAIVLGTVDFGEADRLVTLFTRDHGKLTAFAAGARKSRRRFAGALDPGTLCRAQLVERRGATQRLDALEVEDTFHGLRADLGLISRAMYCLELCRELLRDQEPHPALFDALAEYLAGLEKGQRGPTSLIAFELEALAQAGLQPRFDVCCVCGGGVGERALFDPSHGGAVCLSCGPRAQGAVAVQGALCAALAALQAKGRTPLPPAERQRARELLNLFIAHHLGRKLRSVEFMAQVGLD